MRGNSRLAFGAALLMLALVAATALQGNPASADGGSGGPGGPKGKRTPTSTRTATSTPTPTSTPTAKATSTSTPTETSTASSTATPVPVDTSTPTAKPTDNPTATPTESPTATPTLAPLPVTVLTDQAVTYQLNAAHNGVTQNAALQPPFVQRWTRDLGTNVSYPLIAGGKVFVTVSSATGYGTSLYALDAATGNNVWGPTNLGGTYWWSALAYDNNTVFAVNYDGVVSAFAAADGALRWSVKLPGQWAFTSPPTVVQGVLYLGGAGSGGTLYALDTTTGSVLWSSPVVNGDHSSPVVVGDAVFVSYACPNVYRFHRLTGQPQWLYSTGCSGGGGKTPAYYDQRLYVRDAAGAGYVFDTQNGQLAGWFKSATAPALADGQGYLSYENRLTVWDLSSMTSGWSFSNGETLTSAPLVVNNVVLVGTASGNLIAVDRANGQEVWRSNVGAPIPAPDEQNVSQPLTGLGAGEGLLVVPAGHLLAAYTGSSPAPTAG